MRGGAKVAIESHRHEGIYIARGKEDSLVTKNMVPGESVYNEKRISVEVGEGENKEKVEYRVWNPFRSKLAAAILAGLDHIYMKPGCKLLYLGAASGTTVSHCSDLVGPEGNVYAVEFSHRSDQGRIVGLNAQYFLKNEGHFAISIKASCIDSTAQPEAVFAREVKKLQEMELKPKEQITLEPFERDHAMVVGVFRPPPKEKAG
eukprot:evm.model.scf_441EXC.12 EVM.evm.TU.scf_441EXC.12   scf_441EXC:55177-57216(+)